MKYHYTLLALLLASCVAKSPAPVEVKGAEFYGKNNSRSQKSDYNSDFVFKGRSGESLESKAYNNSEYSEPSYPKSNKSGIIKSSKLAAPVVNENIDEYEYSNDDIEVPTSKGEINYHAPKAAKALTRSEEYLDLTPVNNAKKPTADVVNVVPEKLGADYKKERTDKLKNIKPASKPKSLNENNKEQEEAVDLEPKEKPKKTEEIKKEVIKKEPEPKEESFIKVPDSVLAIAPATPVEKEEPASAPEPKTQDIASIPKVVTPAPAAGKFVKPVEGKIIKEFGGSSDGITIQAAEGTPVKAANGGEVVYSGNQLQGYGNMIVIKHPNGYLTAYSHLEDLAIKKGTKVGQGDVIGKVGKTGNVTTPQLHFGVRKGRNAVNPRDYL